MGETMTCWDVSEPVETVGELMVGGTSWDEHLTILEQAKRLEVAHFTPVDDELYWVVEVCADGVVIPGVVFRVGHDVARRLLAGKVEDYGVLGIDPASVKKVVRGDSHGALLFRLSIQ